MASDCTMLTTDALGVAAGKRVLVDALSGTFGRGEFWALLGANGAGKSTLLLTLAGLRPAGAGDVQLGSAHARQPIGRIGPQKLARVRAYMQQQANDAFGVPVRQFVMQARAPFDSPWQFDADSDSALLVDEALRDMDVMHLAGRNITGLSGGERQRVAVAAALAQNTDCLLLDEPTAHLDPAHQMLVMRHLRQRQDKLVIAALHDLNLALRFCTHAVLLLEGKTLAGPVNDVITEQNVLQLYGAPVQLTEVAIGADRVRQALWL